MLIPKEIDPIGTALLEYQNKNWDGTEIDVDTTYTEGEVLPVAYFFRDFDQMPLIEQQAIEMSSGKILDVGAGAGCHALELEKRNANVKAIDISEASIEVMQKRGVKNVHALDFVEETEKYDTILMLMNGAGVFQTIDGMNSFFKTQLKDRLNEGGQLLVDSSDLIYLFEEEDGSFKVNINDSYHGEVDYFVRYKDIIAAPFKWLYVSFDVLAMSAEAYGFKCEKVVEGEHFDFLAKITLDK